MKRKMSLLSIFAFVLALSFDAFAGGNIVGTIKYDGSVPNLTKINMAADPKCVANNSGDVMPHVLVLGEGQTVANVFVKVTKGLEGETFDTPTEAKVIDQKGCMYYPHVTGVQKDQALKILNSDGTLHNVHIFSKENGEQNDSMPAFRKEITKNFAKAEDAFPVKCDVHPWMQGYIEVLDHPFYSETKPDGKFKIEGLDAGDYEITVWHEKLGSQTFNVTVKDGEDTTQDVTLKKPGTAQLDAVMLYNWQ